MRGGLVAVLLLLGASASARDGTFAVAMPGGVVDVTGWEIVSGEFETPSVRGTYRFYVNPRRQAMYQVMRYQVQLLIPATDAQRQRHPGERVAFVRRPGAREPLLCWRHEPSSTAAPWRVVPAGTEEYKMEMATLINVLAAHRTALAARDR